MIPEAGHFALCLALAIAIVQALVPGYGAIRRRARLVALAVPAALAQFALVAAASAALVACFIRSDFSVALVANHSHSAKPLLYRIAGSWGQHEGSLLLWTLVLALCGGAVALLGRELRPAFRALVLAVQGAIGAAFLMFILFASNPFARLVNPPIEGEDLNPLLQDPGLAFHPPLLYLGYVGFSVAFAFAVAALIEGRVDAVWARWVRPWTLGAWACLTLGIALGSWWAYYTLGWGGFWFWDPVENASLLPWLLGTALVHSALVVERREALKAWTILLAILAFGLSLLGTFLVRSGVLTSVHSFAADPGRGLAILAILGVFTGGALLLFAWRAPALAPGGLFAPISREGALVLNNLLLSTLCLTVLLGTLYPLLLEAVTGETVSVGPPYFDAVALPIAAPLLLLMGVGPFLPWKKADWKPALKRLRIAALLTALAMAAVVWFNTDAPPRSLLGLALGFWCIAAAASDLIRRADGSFARLNGLPGGVWGTVLAHAGAGVLLLGLAGATGFGAEAAKSMKPGDTLDLAGRRLTFDSVEVVQGDTYTADRARFTIRDGETVIAVVWPEHRWYEVAGMATKLVGLQTRPQGDFYVVLGDRDDAGLYAVRAYRHPLMPWLWIGAAVMAAGGVCSLADRRLRLARSGAA